MEQPQLFAIAPNLPEGMVYEPAFLTAEEERALLAAIGALPLHEARYKDWNARRRIVSYGGRYDFSRNELLPADPIAPFLHPLRDRIAAWSGIPSEEFGHALVSEYSPGTPLGWHRDIHHFGTIVGVSLAGTGRMRLRPYPPQKGRCRAALVLDLEPRSAYILSGPARWEWQHAISPTMALRYSITFRTLSQPGRSR
jgi:alkylated DNA repair dioxygenase AlkB